MRLDDMDGSFRQPDVMTHFVLGVLSWSSALASAATLERSRQEGLSGPEASPERAPGAALELLLGIISFDQTLRAALHCAGVERAPERGARGVQATGDWRLAR
jgi:hypothetical protein